MNAHNVHFSPWALNRTFFFFCSLLPSRGQRCHCMLKFPDFSLNFIKINVIELVWNITENKMSTKEWKKKLLFAKMTRKKNINWAFHEFLHLTKKLLYYAKIHWSSFSFHKDDKCNFIGHFIKKRLRSTMTYEHEHTSLAMVYIRGQS